MSQQCDIDAAVGWLHFQFARQFLLFCKRGMPELGLGSLSTTRVYCCCFMAPPVALSNGHFRSDGIF